jgi:hypothetical protein
VFKDFGFSLEGCEHLFFVEHLQLWEVVFEALSNMLS